MKERSRFCLFLVLLLVTLELAACVADRGLVAATAFDPQDYKDREIRVLPVAIAPSIDRILDVDQVSKGVVAAIKRGARLSVREVTNSDLGDLSVEFPVSE